MHYTYDDFERAVMNGDAALASTIEAYLLEDPYPQDTSGPNSDSDPSVGDFECYDEMTELHKAALNRGQP